MSSPILPRSILGAMFALASSVGAHASTLDIQVHDALGAPVPDAVVWMVPLDRSAPPANDAHATMDQRNLSFVPQVLVVQTGTHVQFPNSDNVRHHVYSFSPAKRFELKLYAGNHASSVLFDHPGVDTLGCNIHDWMLGYVVVVDTPWFAKTGHDGMAHVDVPPGRYTLNLWDARQAPGTARVSETVSMGDQSVERSYVLTLHPPELTNSPPPNLEIGLGDRASSHAH